MVPISAVLDELFTCTDCRELQRSEARGESQAAIRAFRGRSDLELSFLTAAPNPFVDDGTMYTYVDPEGIEYWTDAATGILIHLAPTAHLDPPPREIRLEKRRAVVDLRKRTETLIRRQMPLFDVIVSTLHPFEGNRQRNVYFFRWEDYGAALGESDPAPFVQVALYADGELASFTNTLLYGRHRALMLASL